ncbi:hypothetical protein BD779DRAFT_1623629 [Infundibulicybe gibba]|nr:hypothetical protein BD779DRAFT_1623629 [Infundibulicybe gibba]
MGISFCQQPPPNRRCLACDEEYRRKLSAYRRFHYYVPNPLTGVGVNPKWDFTSQGANAGNPNAFVIAARVAGLSAPTGPSDIDWVSLSALTGELAQEIYRVDTRGGQPPATCTPGSPPIVVKYTAKYWLFGGSVKQ